MATYTVLQNNFVSGEIDPMLEGRLDSSMYQTGLAVCENFIPTMYGSLIKRPGSALKGIIGSVPKARIVLFDAGSAAGRFMVEFSNNLMRFWTDEGALVAVAGTTFSIATTYTEAQVDDLSCVVNKGVMYIVHPSHKPAKLTIGASPTPFVLADITFTGDVTFAASGDYPSCQAFKGGRWYLSGTTNNPNTIYASRTPSESADRYTDFTFSEIIDTVDTVLPSHAIFLQETDMYGSRINWMVSHKRIIVGAGRSIWMDSGEMATPATFDMNVTLNTGASKVRPQAYQGQIIFAGTGGKSLHMIQYSQDSAGYVGVELSMTARHMLTDGIREFVVMEGKLGTVIWVALTTGKLVSCTLDANNGVVGWSRHPLGKGKDGNEMLVKSLEVLPGDEDGTDVLWFVAKRSGNLYLEEIGIGVPQSLDYDSDPYAYTDCHVHQKSTPLVSTFTYAPFAGETIDAVADRAIMPLVTLDASGVATYARSFHDIVFGFPLHARIVFLRPELPANGTSIGKNRQYISVALRLLESLGGAVLVQGRAIPLISLIPGVYELGDTLPLFSGDKRVDVQTTSDYTGSIELNSEEPLPFTLLAFITTYGLVEV